VPTTSRSLRRSVLAGLAACLLGAALPSMASASPSAPAIHHVKTQVVLGGVKVSWDSAKPGVSYTASAVGNSALSCSVVGRDSCTVPIASLGSWSFVVTDRLGSSTASSAPSAAIPTHLVIISAGQSNSVGATSFVVDPVSKVNYMAAPYSNGADANDSIIWANWFILRPTTPKGQPITTAVPLDTPQRQTYASGVWAPSFGPEIGVARQIWTDTKTPLTVIKAAFAGTSLAQNWNASNGALFTGMSDLVTSTMTADAKKGQLDVLGAFVWYQGEADSMTPAWAASYQANLSAFITALRSHLPSAAQLPVVLIKESVSAFTSLSCSSDCASLLDGDATVRAADDAVAASMPRVVEVDSLAADRTSYSNYLHLSNVGELQVGSQAAAAVEPLITGLSSTH